MNPSSLLKNSLPLCAGLLVMMGGPMLAGTLTYQLRIEPVERDRAHVPVTVEIFLPVVEEERGRVPRLQDSDGITRPVQAEFIGSGRDQTARLSWVEPSIAGQESPRFTLTLTSAESDNQPGDGFRFEYGEGFQDLFFGNRGIYRYVTLYDPARHQDTHKPYHQIYRFDGEGFITKGPGGDFQHHKGIYLGWNHTRIDGQNYDFWHAPREYQKHEQFLDERKVAGPVFARSASTTHWNTPAGQPLVRDTREVTTWKLAGDRILLDYVITIQSLVGDFHLGGDAHHAGFQFRASQKVAERAAETVILSPAGAKENPKDLWSDAQWMAMAFNIEGQPYTVVHLDHPDNPGPTTYSTRNYGRFGAFFSSGVEAEEPLVLKYRLLVKNADPEEAEVLSGLHADFLEPASVRVESLQF
jgi:hypothetical protein